MTGRSTAIGAGPQVFWRLAIRRDRTMVPIWWLTFALTCYVSAASRQSFYTTTSARVAAATALNASAALVALYGPIPDVASQGQLAMTKLTVLYSTLVSVMLLFVIRRHTRADEDAGRSEMLAAMATSRTTPLRATMLHGTAVSLGLGLVVAAVNTLGGLPAGGSLVFGAMWAGTGLVAVGVSAVACQVGSTARMAAAVASITFSAMYALRMVGDTTNASWLGWLSPYGWNTRVRAYGDTRPAVLGLYVVAAAALMALADLLRAGRDLGAGLLQPRTERVRESSTLVGPLSLGLRAHRPMLIGWTVVIAAWGLLFGALTPSFDSFNTEQMTEMLARLGGHGSFRDILITAVASLMGLIVSCFVIAVVGHAGSDEIEGRTAQLLATASSRAATFRAVATIAIVGSTWVLAVAGVAQALGLGHGTDHSFPVLVAAALVQAPAVWLVGALGLLFFSLRPAWAPLGWGLIVAFATLGQVAEMLDLPEWIVDLSPYAHVPRMPAESFRLAPTVILTALTAVVLAVSWLSYSRRDIG